MNDLDSGASKDRTGASKALRALGYLVSFILALVLSFVATLVSTNKFYGPDVGIGVAFAIFIGIPLALLLALIASRLFFQGELSGARAFVYPVLSAVFAAILGPLVIAILLRLV